MAKRTLAVFDVDGTIFRSSLIIELVKELIERRVFPKNTRLGFQEEYEAWLDRKGNYEAYVDALVATFMKHIQGVHYGDLADVAKIVIEKHKYRTYRYTRDLVRTLSKKDYYLLAISQSPKTVLEGFGKELGFDKVYGRMYEIGPEDRFTGAITDLHVIANKANIVHRMLEKEDVTLAGSIGVGDTEGDISFLELVERPICFNPNTRLYKHAKRMNWEVVVERKDVIYEI